MYKDPITPRAYPQLLQERDYDPFLVMPSPDSLTVRPRIATTPEKLRQCRERLARQDAPTLAAWQFLRKACPLDAPAPSLPDKPDASFCTQSSFAALRYALAAQLDPDPAFRRYALQHLRLACRVLPDLTITDFALMHPVWNMAAAYDALAAGELDAADRSLCEDTLQAAFPALDRNPHLTCNNHNSAHMLGLLAAGSALGDRQAIHDALYGHDRNGKWRYGLLHLLRHDFLADGMQWEGAMGYHMLVMLTTTEMLTLLEHLGIDLWRRPLPPLTHDDGFDEHRGYGPKGTKRFKAAFDAFFYQAFPNGDYTLLHDQVLGNIRGTYAWSALFNKAYDVYGDPKYAWVLQRVREAYPETAEAPRPAWFRNGLGEIEFLRLSSLDYPAGHFSFAEDAPLSLSGRHANGCSLFPVHGSAILRAQPARSDSLAAWFYFGPHWAGHRSPAALHLDLHAQGRRLTTAPRTAANYSDDRHLTWNRTTIAHNTVTVDETPMFPYDFDTDSIWECDLWRDRISNGRLDLFQPNGDGFKAARARNDNVYDGVVLDRTVVLTPESALDVYRVTSEAPHQYDWAVHVAGRIVAPPDATAATLGNRRGYQHLSSAKRLPATGPWLALPFRTGPVEMLVHLFLGTPAAAVFLADDPDIPNSAPIGEIEKQESSQAIIVRTNGTQALFVVFWTFVQPAGQPIRVEGNAATDVIVELQGPSGSEQWRLPVVGPVLRMRI
jgi:hypothetical protein